MVAAFAQFAIGCGAAPASTNSELTVAPPVDCVSCDKTADKKVPEYGKYQVYNPDDVTSFHLDPEVHPSKWANDVVGRPHKLPVILAVYHDAQARLGAIQDDSVDSEAVAADIVNDLNNELHQLVLGHPRQQKGLSKYVDPRLQAYDPLP